MYDFVHAIWLENSLGEITTSGYGYQWSTFHHIYQARLDDMNEK
jgi:hypothetical protein